MKRRITGALASLAALVFAQGAAAQIPSSAPYYTDPENLSVQDETSQGIANLNMVLCVVAAMDPSDMVNAGPYLALFDMNKCQAITGNNASAGSAANYASAVVDATRASNADPMTAKVWISLSQQTNSGSAQVTVYAYLNATQAPTSSSPYGVFRLDYIGYSGGQVQFNGYIDATANNITYLETGSNSSNTALSMTANSTSAGSGTMTIAANGGSGSPSTFNFAYDPSYFHRNDGTNDVCFDRSRANASTLVWQYGTYNANDGTRVDQAHPGIPLLATYGGSNYYGFGNYWGISFQGLSLPDGQPVANLTVSDQRPGNSTTYQLSKVGGKLTQWSQVSATLSALDGIPFTVGADLTGLTSGNTSVTGWGNWVLQWSNSTQSFTVVGTQNCGSNGCTTSNLSPAAAVNAGAFNNMALSGWANSFGGNLNIPPTGAPHVSGDAIYYYNQTLVVPGSAPLTLYCLSQCPTTAQLAAFSADASGATTPYGNGTDQQWNSAASSANTVTYTFGASGLVDTSSGAPVVLESPSQYPSASPYAQNGISSGWLFTTPLTSGNCTGSVAAGTVCQPANPATYYTWQTGPQQWNQALWLTTGGNLVPFDPPQNINYTVPAGAAYGAYAGLPILLQFNGFGNLQGIPGSCVDPVNNAPEDCSVSGSMYVPSFSIPDGTAMTLPGLNGGAATPLLVRALNGEILLAQLTGGQCTSMTLTPLPLPSGGLHDPSNPADSEYLGTQPTVTGAPKVLNGVPQS